MRAWLYDLLITDPDLQPIFGGVDGIKTRVVPRRSQENINIPAPYIIFGLGNATSEDLGDSTADGPQDRDAERQFFQIWIHDEGESFVQIDDLIEKVKKRLIGASDPVSRVLTVRYLETSQEFSNQTYNTIFRYIRFQAIKTTGGTF